MVLAEHLRKSVLQVAIEGKLVPQDSNDEPASILLSKIKAEKDRLIKEKKIAKEPIMNEYTDEDIPFDIPESWQWVQLGQIVCYQNGYAFSSADMSKENKGMPVIKSNNLMTLEVVLNPKTNYVEKPTEKMLKYQIYKDDLLMCLSSQSNNPEPLGKTAIYKFNFPSLLNQRVLKLRAVNIQMVKYLYYVINSFYFHYGVSHKGGGSAQSNLKLEHVREMLIPIPPLNEQYRIVSKVEELMKKIDEFETTETKLESIKKAFPNDLKKSLLQAAIQGKLTEQLPTDSSVDELLGKIKLEKEQLIKEKKVKKERPLDPISENEIPFDIPGTWKWVRLNDVCKYIQRGKSPKYSDIKKYPVVAQKCNQWSGFSLEKAKFIKPESLSSYGEERLLQNSDLLWNSTGLGTVGRMAIYDVNKNLYGIAVADSHVTVIRTFKDKVLPEYVYYYIANPTVQSVIEDQTEGSTKQKELNLKTVKNYLIPLPPLEEQYRIIDKLKNLLPHCESLAE